MRPAVPAIVASRVIAERLGLANSALTRRPSPAYVRIVPPASVVTGSMLTALPLWSGEPIVPPVGLMLFLAWRLLQPGVWAIWAGFPLGLADDLFSGQPLGSGALLWSLIMLQLDYADRRTPWRDWKQDWLIASAVLLMAIVGASAIVAIMGAVASPLVLLPQMVMALLGYPLGARLVARLDRWRMRPR